MSELVLTTPANNPTETANDAPNGLLATNPPGYTGGRLAAEQAGGVVSSKGREQSMGNLDPSRWTLTDASGTRSGRYTEDWWAVADRAAAKYGSPPDPDEPLRYARALAMARRPR